MTIPTVSVAAPAPPAHRQEVRVTSSTFRPDGPIPAKAAYHQCGGQNVSPQLAWIDVPRGVKSFALMCFDPDAPTGVGFHHWIVANIPASATDIPEDAVGAGRLPAGVVQGLNDYGESTYGGPCPPPGDPPHRYLFTIYALDIPEIPGAGPLLTGARLVFSMRGHLLAQGALIGRYGR